MGLILAEICDREPKIPPTGGLGGPFKPPIAVNLILYKTPSKKTGENQENLAFFVSLRFIFKAMTANNTQGGTTPFPAARKRRAVRAKLS